MKKTFEFGRVAVIGLALAMMLITSACESGGGGDSPDSEAASITGDAGMLMINNSSDETTVYFDGVYIGNVSGDGSRQWDVPAGSHVVRIDNAERDNSDDVEQRFSFRSGYTTTIHFDWEEE